MECEFCKKVFKTKYSLSTHQQSTKSCLLIQGKLEDESSLKYECNFCEKKFSLNHVLERHENSCKVKRKEEQDNATKQLEDYKRMKEDYKRMKEENKRMKEENKKLRAEIKQQRQYEKDTYKKELEIQILKTKIEMKDSYKDEIEKKENKYLNTIKDVVNKSNKTTNNNTTNTINNIYIKQQIDKLTPINELPNLIATNPMLSSTLRNMSSLDDFYYLCANTTKKCFLVKDSSREIVSGRKLDENNKVEYVSGKMQSLIGEYIVNEDLSKKVVNEYKEFIEKITENPNEEMEQDDIILGQKLLLLSNKITKANKNKNKLLDEEVLNGISKKAMALIPKIKNKDDPEQNDGSFKQDFDIEN